MIQRIHLCIIRSDRIICKCLQPMLHKQRNLQIIKTLTSHLLHSTIRMHNIHHPLLLLQALTRLIRKPFTSNLKQYIILPHSIST